MASAPRRSALYCGTVTHSRRQPNAYQFTYSVFLVYVDLLELAHHRWRFPPWPLLGSHAWVPAVAWLQKRHHLKGFQGGSRRRDPVRGRRRTEPERLDDAVRQLVQRELHLAEPPRGPIRLLTNLTYWGIEFNPVSFYYVFDEADQRVEYVVAEINNIPWFEQHAYVLRPCQDGEPATRRGAATGVGRSSGGASGVTAGSVVDDGTDDVVAEASPPPPSAAVTRSSSTCWLTRRALGGSAAAGLNGSNNNNHLGGRWDDSNAFFTVFEEHPKAFHVSPFIPMDRVHYKWLFSRPGVATVRVFVELHRAAAPRNETSAESGKFFGASLKLRRVELTTFNLILCLLVYPLMTLQTMLAIHYEAAKLYWRGFRFYPHPRGTRTLSSQAIAVVVRAYECAAAVLQWLMHCVLCRRVRHRGMGGREGERRSSPPAAVDMRQESG
ncbi:hypothetical protein CDCA_CDCA05G1705 [Cyanidium caldarium]|uniref:Uncharacterized protein n=1 Tax=Cyanidium caldarium TaxID=2771 RepID=A0AAV9IU83_CYACA|nr:hypothetical protein CDCA_CDCA05G1705 [Cyanidium caldarium]